MTRVDYIGHGYPIDQSMVPHDRTLALRAYRNMIVLMLIGDVHKVY